MRFVLAVMMLGSTACTGNLLEIVPPAKKDGGTKATTDAGTGTTVPFDPNIQADITALGCAAGGCHSPTDGNAPILITSPMTAMDFMTNCTSFKGETTPNTPDQSPILVFPGTATSGHTGTQLFMQGDAQWNRWLAWISNGEPCQ